LSAKRIRQISEDIRAHVATLLVMGRLSDPRLRGATILEVKVSPDLQLARIYFSILGETAGQRTEAEKGFKSAAAFIRRSLGDALKLRYTPEIVFEYDETAAQAAHMNDILNQVRREREENEVAEPSQESESDTEKA
jgi:ribosome-binding factor A